MENWNEIRTAFELLRQGTVSGAAETLGVHRATILRQIDSLEAALGEKLFIRGAKGYSPTEAGADLLGVAAAADEHFQKFTSRSRDRGSELVGDVIITALEPHLFLMMPAIREFQKDHPNITISFLPDRRIFRLDVGEAHVAIRTGSRPDEPDNVVQHFRTVQFAAFASDTYVTNFGLPKSPDDLSGHRFIGGHAGTMEDFHPPFFHWMDNNIPDEQIVFTSSDPVSAFRAVEAGLGIGFLPIEKAHQLGHMQEVLPHREEWDVDFWLVTHVDVHRSPKVHKFLDYLKEWPVHQVTY